MQQSPASTQDAARGTVSSVPCPSWIGIPNGDKKKIWKKSGGRACWAEHTARASLAGSKREKVCMGSGLTLGVGSAVPMLLQSGGACHRATPALLRLPCEQTTPWAASCKTQHSSLLRLPGIYSEPFCPPRSMALQRTAGAPRLRRSSSLRLTADPVLQEREEGGFTAVPPILPTWLAVSPALQKCLESKLEAYWGISAAGSET